MVNREDTHPIRCTGPGSPPTPTAHTRPTVNGEDALTHLTQWGQGAGGGHGTARPPEDQGVLSPLQGPLTPCRASLLEKGWGRVWAPTCKTDNRDQKSWVP